MTQYYLMNNVVVGTSQMFAGSLIDDANTPTAPILAAGGVLELASITGLAAAAALAQSARLRGNTDVCESIMNAALDKSQQDFATAHDTVVATTATNAAMADCGSIYFAKPIAAELITVVADVLIAAGALVIAAQPDWPRKLQVNVTDGDGSITAGIVTLVGTAFDGTAVTETVSLVGAGTKVTTKVYASLTSATVSGLAGNGAGDNVSIGVGAALGLPIPADATSVSVLSEYVDGTKETVGTVDATARSVAPTTACNGTRNFVFNYRFTRTPTQASHTHSLS